LEAETLRFVLASDNRGKLAELKVLFAPLGVDLLAQGELSIEAAAEDGLTFVENALAKARHASRESGLAAIGDDSGLVVEALDGAPGIRSARYAGTHGDDAANNRKLIDDLAGYPSPHRAAFYCVLVLVLHPEDPAPVIASAAWHGEIVDPPRGNGGFGYDPHFLIPDLGCTAAELRPDQKHELSHRGQAARTLLEQYRRDRLVHGR
jgi:XTP/dITP diphosphohydrolase